jgi:hypothetical protein
MSLPCILVTIHEHVTYFFSLDLRLHQRNWITVPLIVIDKYDNILFKFHVPVTWEINGLIRTEIKFSHDTDFSKFQ